MKATQCPETPKTMLLSLIFFSSFLPETFLQNSVHGLYSSCLLLKIYPRVCFNFNFYVSNSQNTLHLSLYHPLSLSAWWTFPLKCHVVTLKSTGLKTLMYTKPTLPPVSFFFPSYSPPICFYLSCYSEKGNFIIIFDPCFVSTSSQKEFIKCFLKNFRKFIWAKLTTCREARSQILL